MRPFTTAVSPPESAPSLFSRHRENSETLSGLRLLVVEDERDSRELIEALLSSEGATVLAAATAIEALGALDGFRPDVLVSDIGMPDNDGYWLIDQVRTRHPHLPTIALTAFTRDEDVTRARSAGFDQHVGKPVDPKGLVRTIAALALARFSDSAQIRDEV